ncbi:hypothetical protein SAMN05216525_116122 [Bradyrhizobium sp. Gha]|nr:hypothetical protein SAMN05216525_116122 [Bradyrhizobium sp. Gha]
MQTVFWLSVEQNFASKPNGSAFRRQNPPETKLHCDKFVREIRRSIEMEFYATDIVSGGATWSGSGQT